MRSSELQVMDISSLKAVIKDLQSKIIPSRFEKAQQPESNTLQIGLRTLKGLIWLEFCWSGSTARLVEINSPLKIGAKSTLAQQIQHGLKNLTLVSINQKGFERIVQLAFAKRPGDPVLKFITLELMGRHSNFFLSDKNQKVITLGRQIRNHQSRFRPISTGDTYTAPPPLKGIKPRKEEPFKLWKEKLSLLPIPLKKALQETYQGISPSLALQLISNDKQKSKEILELNVREISINTWKEIHIRWLKWLNAIYDNKPSLYFIGPTDFRIWSCKSSLSSEKEISLKLGYYYRNYLTKTQLFEIHLKLKNNLIKLKKEENNSLENQKKILKEGHKAESIREEAHKLLCLNSPEQKQIQKAQTLYKKAKKLERSISIIGERINLHTQKIINIEESINFLDSLLSSNFENDHQKLIRILDLQEELEEHLLKTNQRKTTSRLKKQKISNHLELLTPEGVSIQVGRNHRQNEFISIKKAKKGDLWFHAQECVGSHVVLKASIKIPSEADIQIAADLAALFSKSKGNKKTPIVMTQIEKLKKIPGVLPGTVTHSGGIVLWGESNRGIKHISTNSSRDGLSSNKSP